MPVPLPHQISGGRFLAAGGVMLADEPRVGKTGASIIGLDLAMARRVLVVTTASGRANFGFEVEQWQSWPRRVQVIYGATDKIDPEADVLVVGWSVVADKRLRPRLEAFRSELAVLDEAHYGKSFEAKRTVASMALGAAADQAFLLTGTPMPNSPLDLWPALKTFAPQRVKDLSFDQFMNRYCVVRHKWIAGERKPIVLRGRNEDELRQRLDGFWLRRTQQDVGIREPIFSVLALEPGSFGSKDYRAVLSEIEDADEILAAAETGDTKTLEQHLGTLRRVTGMMKAFAVADVVLEEMANAKMDRVVLMCWHTATIDTLAERLRAAGHGVSILDGRTPARDRAAAIAAFQSGRNTVFVGQILAAGEAIDLSIAQDLIFVEPSFAPKDMKQAALRITNHAQTKQCLVRVAALAGSIDETLMSVLTRKVASIRKVQQ